MNPNWVALAATVTLLVFVIELLRRGILRERFAALWLGVSTVLVLAALFPRLVTATAGALGFQIASNLLFFSAIVFLLLVAVQLSHEVSRLEARTRRLAEELALLNHEVRALSPRTTDQVDVGTGEG